MQQSLKSSFGTKKGHSKVLDNQTVDSDQVTTTVKETQSQATTKPPQDLQHDEDSQLNKDSQHDKDSQHNKDNNSNDTNNVPSSAPVVDSSDNSNQLSSKEKLAKFSFEQKS